MAPFDPELLPLLACPESRQPLQPAPQEVLQAVNEAIAGGSYQTQGGKPVEEEVEEGLLREDGRVLYRIRGGIPVLLIDEGLPVPGA